VSEPVFVCPRCAHFTQHPLEVYFQWCSVCKTVTGIPRKCAHETQPVIPWQSIRDNQDDCLIAIQRRNPLPVKALKALPPWRAVMMATVANRACITLERGTLAQIHAEAVAVGGDGKLGDWWERPE
jgi:hypothetical protein